MIGMDARTGRRLEGDAHLAQSIADILGTLTGTRVMRRDYGSLLPLLIDAPANAGSRVRLYGASATALARQEPRIRITRLELIAGDTAGSFSLNVTGQRTDSARAGTQARFTVPIP